MKESIPHRKSGWYLLSLITALPLILWVIGGGGDISNTASVLRSLGQATGLVGLTLFALSFLLSLRGVRAFEDLFGGLNHLYFAHHVTGGLAFVMLLFHPVLLAARLLVEGNPDRAAWLLLPNRLGAVFGWLGIGLMIVFLGATFFLRLKYHKWHGLHLLSGAAFIFSVAHTFVVPSDVSRDPVLGTFIGSLSFAGLGAFLWRLIAYTDGPSRYEYRVSEVKHHGPTTIELTLQPLGPRLNFQAGQFAYASLTKPHLEKPHFESHPFSITSDPQDREIQFVIEALGDATKNYQRLKVGDLAYLEGPYGRFSFRNVPRRKQIWIAGGIGVTPFLSMARSLRRKDKGFDIDMYYCTATKTEACFWNELRQIDKSYTTFTAYSWCSNREGFITAKDVRRLSGSLKRADILIIGPPPMMDALKVQFLALGLREDQITTEAFDFGLSV